MCIRDSLHPMPTQPLTLYGMGNEYWTIYSTSLLCYWYIFTSCESMLQLTLKRQRSRILCHVLQTTCSSWLRHPIFTHGFSTECRSHNVYTFRILKCWCMRIISSSYVQTTYLSHCSILPLSLQNIPRRTYYASANVTARVTQPLMCWVL